MKNNLVHIAISANTLASLIENERIHAVDFKCLDIDSKKNSLEITPIHSEVNTKEKSRIQGELLCLKKISKKPY